MTPEEKEQTRGWTAKRWESTYTNGINRQPKGMGTRVEWGRVKDRERGRKKHGKKRKKKERKGQQLGETTLSQEKKGRGVVS